MVKIYRNPCVCAGMARSGEVRELEIKDDILKKGGRKYSKVG